MQTIRILLEGFLRGRYGYEGNQVYWALAGLLLAGALLIAILLVAGPLLCVAALALVLRALRVRRLALPLLIGAIVLVG